MRLTVIFLLTAIGTSFAQRGFDKKLKPSLGKDEVLIQKFIEVTPAKDINQFRKTSLPSLSSLLNIKVTRDDETGGVLMIENLSQKPSSKARISKEAMATDFLGEVKKVLDINDPTQELEIVKTEADEIGMTHIQFQQKLNNIPVYGGEIWLHTKGDKIDVLNGRSFPTPKLVSTTPTITPEKAIELAMTDVAKKSIVQKAGVAGQLIKQQNKSELIIYHKDNNPNDERLTYNLTIRPNLLERWTYFIDANSGEILKKLNNTCALDGPISASARDLNNITRTLNTYQIGNTYFMLDTQRPMYKAANSQLPDEPAGGILTVDAGNSTSDNMEYSPVTSSSRNIWNPTAVSAHYNAGICYEYYRTKFGRNSLDNKGGSILSVINIADDDGKGMDNAYWNGEFMGYGNGRDAFKPLAGALDVGGHEMTHGVVEATARLEYQNQSGALNESFADIFGAMIDRDNWTMGESIVKSSAFPSGALRSLSNPNQGGKNDPGYQPKTMSQYVNLANTEEEDNGGVHVNSGIPNYAFYLFASNSAVGKDKAEQVYYRALTKYLTRTSKFVDARLAVVRAAADLYPNDANVLAAAKKAFDDVGILDPSGSTGTSTTTPPPVPTTPQENIPVNNGTDFILVFEPTENFDFTPEAGRLKIYNVATKAQTVISNSGCLYRPSVTDDGQFAYFVGKDKHIHQISLSGSVNEKILTQDPVWRNVAVSKDGKRLAALRYTKDKYIYIFNLETGDGYKLLLSNPTYSSGVNTGEVQYADSFEWDFSGETVIYDFYNTVKSTSDTYSYWDVGIINAWNINQNKIGSGKIEKLLSLEKGESIGNPTYAKNTKNIIAFDYEYLVKKGATAAQDEYAYEQFAIDLTKTGDDFFDTIYENDGIGYPSYSRLDNQMIFNTYNPNNRNYSISIINLATNKISPAGTVRELIPNSFWGVWYGQGTRTGGTGTTKADQTISFPSIADKNIGESFNISATASSNLALVYSVDAGNISISGNRVTVGNTPGKARIKATQAGNTQYNAASATQTFCIIPPTPKITISGNTLIVSGGSIYQWYLNNKELDGQTTATSFKPEFAGIYTVKSVTSDGCFSASSTGVENKVAILATELDEAVKAVIYPNPTADELRIDLPLGVQFKEANFYTSNGRNVLTTNQLINGNSLNISQLERGFYVIKIETSKGFVMRKVVRE